MYEPKVQEVAALSASSASALSKNGLCESSMSIAATTVPEEAKNLAAYMTYVLTHNFVEDSTKGEYKWKSDDLYKETGMNPYYFQSLCKYVTPLLKEDAPFLELKSPIYVFGDIHGNYRDLMRFAKMFGMFYNPRATPAKFLFLGGKYFITIITHNIHYINNHIYKQYNIYNQYNGYYKLFDWLIIIIIILFI